PSVKMNRDNGLGSERDSLFNQARIDVQRPRIDINENRRGTHGTDSFRGCEEGKGGGDNLISRTDSEGPQADYKSIGARVEANSMLRTEKRSDLPLKGLNLRPENELSGSENSLNRSV